MRLGIIIALLSLFNLQIVAQTLTGQVIDASTKEPLFGANVYLKSDWQVGTSTQQDGVFELKLDQQSDTLIITFIGYYEKEIAFNTTEKLLVELQPKATSINEIVIESERLIAEEFSYRKVNRLDIYTNPSAKADPLLAVNSLPSATTLDESANISFRGSSPAETGIFLNNVPIYDAIRFSQLNGIGTFSIFNTSIVDDLQVFPGNPPLEYGNTTSGLVAIQTTEQIPEKSSNSVTLSLASFGANTTQPIGDNTSITLFSNYQLSQFIRGLNYSSLEDIKEFQSNDLGINLTHRIGNNGILKVFNYSLYESYTFNYQSPTFNGDFNQTKKRNFTVTNYRQKFGQNVFTVNSNVSFSDANFNYADTDIDIFNRDLFLSTNYQIIKEDFEIKGGLNYDGRYQKFSGQFYQFDFAEGPGYPTLSNNNEQLLHRPEGFIYGKYYFSDKILIGAGLRKNLPTDEQENYLSRQLNLKYNFSDNLSLTASWGTYNKYNLIQNQAEDTQLINSEQLSLDFLYKEPSLEINLSVFAKETQNLTNKNVYGAELFFKAELLNNLTAQTSFSYLSDERSLKENQFPGKYDLNYFIRGNLNYKLDNFWDVTATFLFRDGQYYQPVENTFFRNDLNVYQPVYVDLSNQQRLPSYQTIDLSVSRLIPLTEKMNIISFASVNNLFNHKNVRDFSYDFTYSQKTENLFSQRTIYFGLVINF